MVDQMERYCDLCKELVPVTDEDRWCRLSCGTYICDDCILSEARGITNDKVAYEVEKTGDNYRVTHIPTDSRVATCYLEENAQHVCSALNKMGGTPW